MTDYKKKLGAKFQPNDVYKNFGNLLRSIKILGFRGIKELTVEFKYPVVAISGLNGAGKSTVGQLCLSGYKKPVATVDYKRFYVRDFFPASIADPNPFTDKSSVVYTYESDNPSQAQSLTVSRIGSEWSGYKRQPERHCYYVGFTIYIPKVERKDLSIRSGSSIQLTSKRKITSEIQEKVGVILGESYDDFHFQGIKHGQKKGELGIASKYGQSYSENNMGFGEGRTLYMVDLLENAPNNSLFVIEEPETSLHEHAQYELGKYLVEVSYRKGHQIIITTHSDKLLNSLPEEGRLLLHRNKDSVDPFYRLSSSRARSFLSRGKIKSLIIFVEDVFAERLLSEILRRSDKIALKNNIKIEPVGSKDAVREALKLTIKLGIKSIAVRDADVGEDKGQLLFSLPGSKPPEKEVYQNENVIEYLNHEYSIDVKSVLKLAAVKDHHKYTEELASAANAEPVIFENKAIEKYVDEIGESAYRQLVLDIKAHL